MQHRFRRRKASVPCPWFEYWRAVVPQATLAARKKTRGRPRLTRQLEICAKTVEAATRCWPRQNSAWLCKTRAGLAVRAPRPPWFATSRWRMGERNPRRAQYTLGYLTPLRAASWAASESTATRIRSSSVPCATRARCRSFALMTSSARSAAGSRYRTRSPSAPTRTT